MSMWWLIAGIAGACKILGRAVDNLRPPDAATISANIRAKQAAHRAEKAAQRAEKTAPRREKRRAKKAAQRARKLQREEAAKVQR